MDRAIHRVDVAAIGLVFSELPRHVSTLPFSDLAHAVYLTKQGRVGHNYPCSCGVGFARRVAATECEALQTFGISLVDEYEADGGDWLPVQRHTCAVIRALIADERNEKPAARLFASLATKTATETHSGLRYHPKVGLVPGHVDASIEMRLAAIGGI